MDRIWREAPTAAWRIRRAAGVPAAIEPNAAAMQWATQRSVGPQALQALAQVANDGEVQLQLGATSVHCRAVPLDDGVLLWLLDSVDEAAARPGTQTSQDTDVLHRALTLAGVSVWRTDPQARLVPFTGLGVRRIGATGPDGMAGIDVDAVPGTIHPDDLPAAVKAAADALTGERVVDVVARYRDAAGGWCEMLTRRFAQRDGSGQVVGVVGVTVNLSQHEAAQRDAQALANQAQLTAAALGVGYWSLNRDSPSSVGTWDAQVYRLFGRAPELGPPSLAQWLAEDVHPDDRDRVRERIQHDSLNNAPTTEVLFRLATPDANGQERWVQSWSRRGSGDRSRTSYGIQMDVSDRQRALALEAQQQRLEQASREQSAFMARMSHELRTPMNAVVGFTRLLQTDSEPLSDRQRERLAYIAEASTQMMALIDDLLAIAMADATLGPAPAPATALHVLCVEDNPVNLQLVRELIALRPAVRLSTAVDGLSGVATALAEPPDLVLLDLQLPDIDGLEVLRRLRAAPTTAACRIVALSADAMPEHIRTAMAAGFDDYWTKPIQFDSFLAGIDRLAEAAAKGTLARPAA